VSGSAPDKQKRERVPLIETRLALLLSWEPIRRLRRFHRFNRPISQLGACSRFIFC